MLNRIVLLILGASLAACHTMRFDVVDQPESNVVYERKSRFIQGLIAIFAGYYVNIYSPWTARVLCDNEIAPPTNESENEIDTSNAAGS